jgi:hypothetical protein
VLATIEKNLKKANCPVTAPSKHYVFSYSSRRNAAVISAVADARRDNAYVALQYLCASLIEKDIERS